jgi:hypothetical protein
MIRGHGTESGDVDNDGWSDDLVKVPWELRNSSVWLNATNHRINARAALLEKSWREIIRVARTEYRGRITYAANFDHVSTRTMGGSDRAVCYRFCA